MTIRLRLALSYGALAAALIAGVCAYALLAYRRSQLEELDAMLVSTAEHVTSELGTSDSPRNTQRLLNASLLLGAATRVYDPEGRLVARDESSARIPYADPRQALGAETGAARAGKMVPTDVHQSEPLRGAFITLADSLRWRAYVLPIARPAGYLTTLLPLTRVERAVARFAWLMLAMTLLGSACGVLFGWLIAGRVLRPVAGLSKVAGEIALSREFTRRVPQGMRHDEIGRLSDTFNTMLGSLEAAYDAQSRFVADASHELRAPLTAIQGNLDIARDHRQRNPAEREYALAEAASETSRMTRLVADLLSLALADTGTALRKTPVELDRLVMAVLGETRHLTRGQQMAIRDIAPCTVPGDADRLKQLMLILVDNAIRYTPPGGRIDVTLRRVGPSAVLVVRDTGIGIAENDLPHVFDRFFRADRARSRDPGGTGLGLSIARWIAEQHGAEISVASEPGRGTTFTVRFACPEAAA